MLAEEKERTKPKRTNRSERKRGKTQVHGVRKAIQIRKSGKI